MVAGWTSPSSWTVIEAGSSLRMADLAFSAAAGVAALGAIEAGSTTTTAVRSDVTRFTVAATVLSST